MIKKGLIALALAVSAGMMVTGISLVWQLSASAKSSDNNEDVKKSQDPPPKEEQPKAREAKIDSASRARQWREKLDQPITIDFEPNTPLREALTFIADRYGMTILLDDEAFKVDSGQPDVNGQPIKLPKLVSVRLRTALRALLEQVNGDYYVKDDVLMVIPRQRVQSGALLRQPVDLDLEKRPLAAALKELSDMTGVSIILDAQKMKDPKLEVTADLRNVPLDCAVRVLADMAGMKSVVMDNLLYVTSIENADRLEEEKAQKRGDAPAKWEKAMLTDKSAWQPQAMHQISWPA
jgi:hypothetical protein